MNIMENKKSLFGILLLIFITIIGITIAYFANIDTSNTIFQSGTYQTVTKEVFESPKNWKPGDETKKTITVKNKGDISVRVRISLEEEWIDKNGKTIEEEKIIENDKGLKDKLGKPTIINLDNENDWIKKDNYYYYNKELSPGDITSSFLKSITFNPNVTGNITCTKSEDGLESNCTGGEYTTIGATYKLVLKIETVQADKYQEIWNLQSEQKEA